MVKACSFMEPKKHFFYHHVKHFVKKSQEKKKNNPQDFSGPNRPPPSPPLPNQANEWNIQNQVLCSATRGDT